jgi:hypothetical protein
MFIILSYLGLLFVFLVFYRFFNRLELLQYELKKIAAVGEESREIPEKAKTLREREQAEDEILSQLESDIEKVQGKKVSCLAIVCTEINFSTIHRLIEKFTAPDSPDSPERDQGPPLKNDLYLLLHIVSGGGVSDCAMISNILFQHLKNHPEVKLTVFIPEIALSSGTQIALHGHEIVMGKFAHLGAIDDQLRGLGVNHVKKIMEQSHRRKQKFTLKEYNIIQQSNYMYDLTKRDLETILQFHRYSKLEIEKIRKLLLDHDRYHSYPITLDEARDAGLKIREMNDELVLKAFYDIYNLWADWEEESDE